jgi:hypothetical protein
MKGTLPIAALIAVVCAAGQCASGQPEPKKSLTPAQLELTAEVAATTDDGYPAALRVTIKNVGTVDVDMPVLGLQCLPDSVVTISVIWTPNDRSNGGNGGGGGCWGHAAPFKIRVENEWVRLRPGEYLTTREGIRDKIRSFGPGTVEYWVEYKPPKATPAEIAELLQAGYIIPTETLHTEHQSFTLR